MKFILLFTIVFCANYGFANFFPVGKTEANLVYAQKAICEAQEQQKCFNVTGLDLRKWQVGTVDDTERPIFRGPDASPVKIDCDSFEDCQVKAGENGGACTAEPSATARWDEIANWPGVTGLAGPWFVWCELITGYEQKDALVPDPAGIAAAEAEDAQKAAEAATRAQARTDRAAAALGCVAAVNGGGTLTQPQIRDCIDILVKEVFQNQIPASDL